ncbi:MAG TPA: tRNA threonylcarbamoyladenosine biosynthesis protein RimN [Thiothrix sp.]|nr:tRNA threonylcarbamoyladenosine biosynthesis protein RimN [Thiothrix sp.]
MLISDDPQAMAALIRQGGVVAYPTEAVFGLGCDPQQLTAVKRILQIKQRPVEKGMILLASQWAQLVDYTMPLTAATEQQVMATWPGAVTWLLAAKPNVSSWVRGQHTTIACRLTAHLPSRALIDACGHAIISTSANPAGLEPARSVAEVEQYFSDTMIDGIFLAAIGENRTPSEIRDSLNGRIIRPA